MLLKNKKILVLGAAGKLGTVLVDHILQHGGRVLAADYLVNAIKQQPDAKVQHIELDVTNELQINAFFNQNLQIDGVVNCTYPRGKNYGANVNALGMSDFNESVSLHLGAAYLICQQAALYFNRVGLPLSVVNLSSVYGVVAPKFDLYRNTSMTMPIEYAAIKAAIIHLNGYFSRWVSNSNFRVNSVSPGGILDGQPKEFLQRYQSYTCGKGMLNAEDVCGPIVFLLSDLAKYINGQNIVVDDGFTL